MTQRANEQPEQQQESRPKWSVRSQGSVFALAVGATLLAVLSPLLQGQRYAFRDVSHFYLPLYDYIAQRTSVEWLPWWNPLDQAGMPLIGETSTAVLYPVRYLIYSLPLRLESAMNAYLIIHLILASATAWWAAKQMGCKPHGRAIAALTYCLSGSVFSLCCNPPFLVGAAWLPLGLGASLAEFPMAAGRRIRCVSLALAMMILGGDPQSALHCMLVAVSVAACQTLSRSDGVQDCRKWFQQTVIVCACSVVLAAGMASLQIAASLDWSLQSERTASQTRLDQYDFSLAPWHVAEIFTARPFGTPFLPNALIAKQLPGEGRMWTPTVYAGSFVAIAFVIGLLRYRQLDRLDRQWITVALVTLALCFGHFGLVWWLQQIPGVLPNTWSAIGGPYWTLETFLPGYDSFRYPVKWLPVFAIACSIVAGRWACTQPSKSERNLSLSIAAIALAAAVAVLFLFGTPDGLSTPLVDEYWGPVDSSHAKKTIIRSLVGSAALFSVIAVLRAQCNFDRSVRRKLVATTALVVVCGADVGITAFGLLPKIDVNSERNLSRTLSVDELKTDAENSVEFPVRHLRTQSKPWPEVWKSTASEERAMEVAVSERTSWFGRWHLAKRQAVFNSMVSIRSESLGEFWRAVNKQMAGKSASECEAQWGLIRRWLGMNGRLHVDGQAAHETDAMQFIKTSQIKNWEESPFRIWKQWSSQQSIQAIMKRMSETLSVPIPSIDGQPSPVRVSSAASGPAELQIKDTMTAVVRCETPVLLERCQFQDGNWHAELSPLNGGAKISLPVLPCSVFNQAVVIPEGDWRVIFYYRPWWASSMVAVSIVCWLSILVPWATFRKPRMA